jgi:hypothetical protein
MMENDLRRAVALLADGDWRAGRALRDDVVIKNEIAALSAALEA